MDLGAMLTLSIPVANFDGEVLKVEFKDGSDPKYMIYRSGNMGGWFHTAGDSKNAAIKQWEKQVRGAYKDDAGNVINYMPFSLERRL